MSLAAMLFSEYRRRVLGLLLLHPQDRYHLREIARLTGTVPGTLMRELSKLTDAGVLAKQAVGRQVFYAANRDCPIFEELAGILRKTSGLVDVLVDALLPVAERIELAFVFGSLAADKATAGSDVDLMVVGELSFSELVAALYPAQQMLSREINPKLYRLNEWQEQLASPSSFVSDVLKKPKLIVMGVMDGLEKS